ncbi:hypothetical protein E3N88_01989 [Mikania micrantha]|uniref:Uncharacterized protein n=1 Tax=Mikania micrantha TaxID=192012 RepID=A0A5N6Q330_9ASTR|nr:hypothetical protein E3N88_01989 [Mikania micrantha]
MRQPPLTTMLVSNGQATIDKDHWCRSRLRTLEPQQTSSTTGRAGEAADEEHPLRAKARSFNGNHTARDPRLQGVGYSTFQYLAYSGERNSC